MKHLAKVALSIYCLFESSGSVRAAVETVEATSSVLDVQRQTKRQILAGRHCPAVCYIRYLPDGRVQLVVII